MTGTLHPAPTREPAPTETETCRSSRGSAIALVWTGMLLGVSFLATPAKFLAPSLSRAAALDVGRHTFRVFGGVELGLAALLGLRATASRPLLAAAPGLIVLSQALLLRPRLSTRTQAIIAGGEPVESPELHKAYVVCEVAKLAFLLTLGMTAGRRGEAKRHSRRRRA